MTARSNRSSGPVLLDFATAFAIVTALVYAAGWTYAYHYFSHFGLGLLTLEIPNQYYFMYGFWVFKAWWWLILLGMLVALVASFYEPRLSPWMDRLKAERPLLLKHLQLIVILLAFLGVGLLASYRANHYYRTQQDTGFNAYPFVRIWPTPPIPEETHLRRIYTQLPSGTYRLLLQNRDTLFLFTVPRDGKPARLAIIQLALDDVSALRVLP